MRRSEKKQRARSVLSAGIELLERRQLLSTTTFAAPVSYNVGASASSAANNVSADGVATGLFNADNKLDLAVVHTVDGTVNILLNQGNGTFSPATSYPLGIANPVWVTVADLNGDGKQDLVVLGNSSVAVLFGNGDGTFQKSVVYATGPVSRGGVAVGDFNGDGKLDLAVAQFGAISSTQSAVDILINNGNGVFKPYYTIGVPPAARSVTVGDFNGDGKADLAVADGEGYNNQLQATDPAGVTILLGNGNGTFTTAAQYNALPTPDAGNNGVGGGDTVNPENIYVADLNHDGKLDLVETLYDHNIDVFLGNGNGAFAAGVGYATGEYPRAVAFTDVNNDGRLDLVVGNVGANNGDKGQTEPGSVAVLVGNGDGTFQSPIQYTPFAFPGWLAAGDFNGDGLPDLAVTRVSDGHSVNILQNELVSSTQRPTVTGISPSSGSTAGGTAVNVTGANFTTAAKVTFGTIAAQSIVINSATSITAVAPAGTGAVDVIVTTSAGASAASALDRFTYVAPVVLPAPTSISPGSSASPGPGVPTTTPTLSWKGIGGVSFTGYQINVYDATLGKLVSYQAGASATSFTIPTSGALIAGHSYAWNVRALNGAQSGPPSINLYFQVITPVALPAPVAIAPGSANSPGTTLTTLTPTYSWQGISSVKFTGYQVNVFDLTASTGVSYQVGASLTSYQPTTTLFPGHAYVWNVRALNGTQSGPPSAYFYFKAPTLPQPVILGVGSTSQPGPAITTLTPTLSWQPVTGISFDSYQINLYDETSKKFLSIQVSPTATSYTLPSGTLTAGDSYVWNLRIKIGSTTGPESTTYLYFQAE